MRYVISMVIGLAAGCLADLCIRRMPDDESLFSRGFRLQISGQSLWIELLMGALFVFHAGFFAEAWLRMIFVDVLSFYAVSISVIDYRHRIIPDELSLSLLAAGLLASFFNPYLAGRPGFRFLHSLSASIGGGLLMMLTAYAGEKAFKKEALGGGDIKLIAASAAALGWAGVAGPLFLGSLSGGGAALLLLISRKKKLGETIPFGPFLCVGIYFTALFPQCLQSLFRFQIGP